MKMLKINGVAEAAPLKAGSLIASHDEALKLILAAETASDFTSIVRDELPAIVSHWLQSPEDPPILLDQSYAEKWINILRTHCHLKSENPASGTKRTPSSPKPVHIDFSSIPFPPQIKPKFTFIDLFAGIGGFRIALERLGGKCVFSSEWDKHAKETYYQNYGEVPFGDITNFSDKDFLATEVNVIAGGFPCQPFSKAGVSARESLGQNHGFSCETQGQLFFDLVKIAKRLKPDILLLENVGNLLRHDGGNTFGVIKKTIEEDLNYNFQSKIYNANTLVPQSRIRCIIVANRKDLKRKIQLPDLSGNPLPLRSILQDVEWNSKYTISEALWQGHIRRSQRNVDRGAGFTAYPKDLDKPSTTLVARYYKDGKECLIPQPNHPKQTPRMLTERECARLQGFPEQFKHHPSRNGSYKQFGNAVPVPLIETVAKAVM
ncbi:DNA cytosine methyltransferase [Opitutaceae bacterium]|nr:DNA cytosine methyltransferase [Opitutaceae bacterium]